MEPREIYQLINGVDNIAIYDFAKKVKCIRRFLADNKILLWYLRMWSMSTQRLVGIQLKIVTHVPTESKRYDIVERMRDSVKLDLLYMHEAPIGPMLESPIRYAISTCEFYNLVDKLIRYHQLNYGGGSVTSIIVK